MRYEAVAQLGHWGKSSTSRLSMLNGNNVLRRSNNMRGDRGFAELP